MPSDIDWEAARALIEGVKKWSLFNVQLSLVIGGGASRNLFLEDAAEGASENDKGQMNIEQGPFLHTFIDRPGPFVQSPLPGTGAWR